MITGGSVQSWRDQVYAAPLPPAVRWFALAVLAPRCGADGIVRTGGAARLTEAWRRAGPRGSCSARLAGRMIEALTRAGLLELAAHSAPGRAASYRIRLVHAIRWAWPRPRGLATPRIHRLFMKEQTAIHEMVPP